VRVLRSETRKLQEREKSVARIVPEKMQDPSNTAAQVPVLQSPPPQAGAENPASQVIQGTVSSAPTNAEGPNSTEVPANPSKMANAPVDNVNGATANAGTASAQSPKVPGGKNPPKVPKAPSKEPTAAEKRKNALQKRNLQPNKMPPTPNIRTAWLAPPDKNSRDVFIFRTANLWVTKTQHEEFQLGDAFSEGELHYLFCGLALHVTATSEEWRILLIEPPNEKIRTESLIRALVRANHKEDDPKIQEIEVLIKMYHESECYKFRGTRVYSEVQVCESESESERGKKPRGKRKGRVPSNTKEIEKLKEVVVEQKEAIEKLEEEKRKLLHANAYYQGWTDSNQNTFAVLGSLAEKDKGVHFNLSADAFKPNPRQGNWQ
jgi:hypothetical protein